MMMLLLICVNYTYLTKELNNFLGVGCLMAWPETRMIIQRIFNFCFQSAVSGECPQPMYNLPLQPFRGMDFCSSDEYFWKDGQFHKKDLLAFGSRHQLPIIPPPLKMQPRRHPRYLPVSALPPPYENLFRYQKRTF